MRRPCTGKKWLAYPSIIGNTGVGVTITEGEFEVADTVVFQVEGFEIRAEVSDTGGPLKAAGAEDVAHVAQKPFKAAIGMVGALADAFADAFKGRKVGAAEITLGLKVTAKGDFIVVGSSGEASLNLKLTLTPG